MIEYMQSGTSMPLNWYILSFVAQIIDTTINAAINIP